MDSSLLAKLKFEITASVDDIVVKEIDYNSLVNNINSLFDNINLPISIEEGELKIDDLPNVSEEDKQTIIDEINLLECSDEDKIQLAKNRLSDLLFKELKENLKKEIINKYSTSSLLLYRDGAGDDLSSAFKNIKDMIDDINNGDYNEEDAEEKAKEILDDLGLDENSTEDEIKEVAEEKAQELIDALNGKESDSKAVNQILNNIGGDDNGDRDGGGIGLRRDIYKRIKEMGDTESIKYSLSVAEESAKYFTTGVLHIAVHTGGASVFGVGTSLLLMALQNVMQGMNTIRSGTTSFNPIDQAQKLTDGISDMYTNGTINSLVIGAMHSGDSIVPFVGNGKQTTIDHRNMKILLLISAIAAYLMLAAGAIATMKSKTQKTWNKMLDAVGAKDGDDLFAMFIAAGIKASLITTVARTFESTAGSTGVGLLIPFGP